MTIEHGLVAVLVVGSIACVVGALGWAFYLRGTRSARDLVRSTSLPDGTPATIVLPVVPNAVATLLCAGLGVPLGLGAILTWSAAPGLAVAMLLLAGYFLVGVWLLRSRRLGDRWIWFTPERVGQHVGAVQQSVRWADIEGIGPGPRGLDVSCRRGPVSSRYGGVFLWTGRQRSPDGHLTLNLSDTHRDLAFIHSAVPRWAEDELARHEIGTPEAVERLLGRRR